MANQNLLIVNPTDTAYSNVNAAGDDIPAYSCGTNGDGLISVLTDAEQATFAAAHPTALMLLCDGVDESVDPDPAIRVLAAKILRLGKEPSKATDFSG